MLCTAFFRLLSTSTRSSGWACSFLPFRSLPQALRADLISIGLWIMREAEQIRLERSTNFRGIIEVSAAIRDGLQ